MTNWLLKINNWNYYFVLCGVCVLFTFATNLFLLTDSLYYSSLSEQYTTEQIRKILDIRDSWKYVGYFFIPLTIIIRVLYSSFCLFLGDLFQESHWGFKKIFNISLKADVAFCFSVISNFYYYAFSENYEKIEDLSVNYFSLLRIAGKENIPTWLVFAFNSLNIFELIYIFLLIIFIHLSFKISYLKSSAFALLTYGIGNYLYIVAITFLYLNMQL